jgi:hypothetical protein
MRIIKISLVDFRKIIEAEKINIQQAHNNIGRQIQNKFNAVFVFRIMC